MPHPFMRIDTLLGEDDLVFGEFTPRPGQFHRFNAEWRLREDLLEGKRFDAYTAVTKETYGSL
jgi:hypothetical protein